MTWLRPRLACRAAGFPSFLRARRARWLALSIQSRCSHGGGGCVPLHGHGVDVGGGGCWFSWALQRDRCSLVLSCQLSRSL